MEENGEPEVVLTAESQLSSSSVVFAQEYLTTHEKKQRIKEEAQLLANRFSPDIITFPLSLLFHNIC